MSLTRSCTFTGGSELVRTLSTQLHNALHKTSSATAVGGLKCIHKRAVHNRKYVSHMYQNFSKNMPKEYDTKCKSQMLMLYNDIMQISHAGTYHILPLGMRALEKLIRIVDEEMQAIGAGKVSLPSLTAGKLWKKTGRWDSTGPELFKLQDRHNVDYCLSPTHEESITELIASMNPISYKRLPIMLYQITRKFRDEMHPKYGLLRGREFEMKDLYTFDSSEDNAMMTYDKVCAAYSRVLNRLGLAYHRVVAATGNIGGTLSHEYHIPAAVGEDRFFVCKECGYGINAEMLDDVKEISHHCPRDKCSQNLEEHCGIEVGHSFLLGTKYSEPFRARFTDESQKFSFMQMGCYGLGITRILQASVEVLSLEKQIRWPALISPYQIIIIPQMEGFKAEVFAQLADQLSDRLSFFAHLRSEVVIDNRTHLTVGKRMYEAKCIGYPYIVVVGKKALNTIPEYELLSVNTEEVDFYNENSICERLSQINTI